MHQIMQNITNLRMELDILFIDSSKYKPNLYWLNFIICQLLWNLAKPK